MALLIVEFSSKKYKIRIFLAIKQLQSNEIIEFYKLLQWGGVKNCRILTFKVNFLFESF